ncbi:hypothetical protein LSH36_50g07025 [Paralvinella palmiformis]|uniref:F5/8 type C domain-containing protein n=1 Tax=Paralvinella palmiformis TaxID=53620 RepID=A0AAD9K5Q8_9ANNE|nr:hypothetical protein LSH36_50g07025 [Paralvinella palmiformis]
MITGDIQDWQITASSSYPQEWDEGCHERYGRVYQPDGYGWCAKYKSSSEWLQVDLGVAAKITGVMTQGRGDGTEWVTSFMMSYSLDAFHWQYVTDLYGNQRVFEGNTDSYTVKHSYLDDPIVARFVKFHTVHWHRHPSMRVEILGCQVCKAQLGLPPYGKLTASSHKEWKEGQSCLADDGFIMTNKGWCPRKNKENEWLQIDIGPPTLVTGVVTRGRGDTGRKHWVTRFKISYSNDTQKWEFYRDATHLGAKEFGGNVDKDIERYHYLNNPFVARYVRFHPLDWNKRISMRAGVIGCPFKVENLAYRKESWINNKRHYKRHIRNQWMHGHAARAVDGDYDQSLHSCTILDNFYVEKPVWMVDLGKKGAKVSGVMVITWQGQGQDRNTNYHDYMYNLDRLVVYISDKKTNAIPDDKSGSRCGEISRLNDAIFRPRLHVQCHNMVRGRYVYIEAWGVANRWSRLFSAVLCERDRERDIGIVAAVNSGSVADILSVSTFMYTSGRYYGHGRGYPDILNSRNRRLATPMTSHQLRANQKAS